MMSFIIFSEIIALIVVVVVLLVNRYRQRRNPSASAPQQTAVRYTRESRNDGIFERFFPKELPELLGVSAAENISTDSQRSFVSSVMSVKVLDYNNAIHTMASEQLFQAINKVFSRLIPVIQQNGIIDSFDKTGMTGLYPNSSDHALTAAVSLCNEVDALGEAEKYDRFAVGLSHGEVMIGVVGHKQRISVVTMAKCLNISEFLREKAAKYGARILVTQDFANQVPNFDKNYNNRLLGYFHDSMRGSMIKVYDVFDGDDENRKQGKRRTKMIFEQGVDHFVHGDYRKARLYFVEVLKADRYDLAAKEYLYMCDIFCNGREGHIDICIETF